MILRIGVILGLSLGVLGLSLGGIGMVFSQTTRIIINPDQTTTIIVQVNPSLTLTIPAEITYTLTAPLVTGTETLASNQSVKLEGTNFVNALDQAYITVSMTGAVTNANIKVTNIGVSTTGVSAYSTTPDITLSTTAQNYAVSNANQGNISGTVTGTHNLEIYKTGSVPAGSYALTLTWTGTDGGA